MTAVGTLLVVTGKLESEGGDEFACS